MLSASSGFRSPILLELAVALGESFPEDGHVQQELSLIARRLHKGRQRRLFPAMRRAIKLEQDPERRFQAEVAFAYLLAHTTDPNGYEVDEFETLVNRLLPRIEDSGVRAVLVSARGRLAMVRDQPELARRDLKAALGFDPGFALPNYLLFVLERDLENPAAALQHGFDYMEQHEQNGGRREEVLTWTWARRAEGLEVLPTVRSYVERDRGHGGWWLRLALLEAQAGDWDGVPAACREARERLGAAQEPTWQEAGERAGRVEAALQGGDRERALRLLQDAVDVLERLRGSRSFP